MSICFNPIDKHDEKKGINKKRDKSITMMRGKSPPHEHKNIHISNNIENCNQLSVSLKVYL